MGRRHPSICRFALLTLILILVSVVSPTGSTPASNYNLFYFMPDRILIVSGDGQSGEAGTVLPEPLVVQVLGRGGNPLPLAQVKFTVVAGGGKLTQDVRRDPVGRSTITVGANFSGKAEVFLILGRVKGINTVEASVIGLDPVTFTATTTASNSPPVLNPIGGKQVNEGSELRFTVSAADPDPGDTVVLSASNLPANAAFAPATGVFSFIPDYTQAGAHQVTFSASDGILTDSETVTITVRNVNLPPVLNPIGNRVVNENVELVIVVIAIDPDGDALVFSVPNMPPGAILEQSQNSSLCTFRWKPGFDTVPAGGSLNFPVTFVVRDPWGAVDSEQVIITVRDAEPPPAPDILVLPTVLDFGSVPVGESADRAFLIYNNGNALLEISRILPTDPQFAILAYLQVESQFVAVTYSEADGKFVIAEYLGAGDQISIIAYCQPVGRFVAVAYSEDDNQFAFAEYLDADDQSSLVAGSETVGGFATADYSEGDPRFVDVVYPAIAPGDAALVVVRFTPLSKGTKVGQVFIISNDPVKPVVSIDVRGVATQAPDIRVFPTSINLGEVQMGQSSSRTLYIYNDGNAVLNIHDIIPDDSQFTVSNYSNVNPGSQIAVVVTFTPSSPGDKTGTLSIVSNDPDEPVVTIPLQGRGLEIPEPDIGVSHTSINFGNVNEGQSSQAALVIRNDGNAVLHIHDIIISNSQFTVSAHSDIDPASQITVLVTFTPTSPGEKTGTLSIASDDPDEPVVQVSLRGTGVHVPVPEIGVWPTSLSYGDVEVGGSAVRNFWIYNYGDATLLISSITSNNTQFAVLDDPDVAPGSSAVIPVRFTPASTGTKTGVVTIASNDPDEPTRTVSLSGKGVITPVPDIRVSPTSLDFGGVEEGSSSDKKIRIYNDGSATLLISGITSNNNQFAALEEPDVAPGGMAEVTIRFTPSSLGAKTGTITIASNDPDEATVTVAVTGVGIPESGPDIYVAPYLLNFGDVYLGEFREQSFYVYNFGNEILQISSITSSSIQFQVLAYQNVPPDSYIEVWVRFTPSSLGTKTGDVIVRSNDPDQPVATVWVSGVGVSSGFPVIGNWQVIRQQNLPMDLYDVNFFSNSYGWVAGYNGTVARSTNGGEAWTPVSTPTGRTLKGISFTSSSNGWAVGQYGALLSTTNGGLSWSSWSSGVSGYLNAVQLVDYNHGWIAGESGTILATTNGYTWQLQNSGTQLNLNDVYFVNANRGWIVGNYGTILRTNNGGQTWIPLNSGTTAALYGVDFVDYYEGWAVGSDGMILHTEDGGDTWVRQSNGVPYVILTDIDLIDSSEGWAVGYNGVMLYTEDGGFNWVRVNNVVNNNLMAVQFRDPDNGWIVGSQGTILKYHPYIEPPVITSVTVYGSPAGTGDVIRVVAKGQPGNQASFSIGSNVSHIPMTESPSGTYTGSYTVVKGVNEHNTAVIVALRNQYGDTAVDMSKTVEIDTTARINWASVSPTITKAGGIVTVRMGGESNGIARFSIGNIAANVTMTEDPAAPGSYTGQYTAPQTVNVTNADVTVQLTDALGNVDTRIAGQLTIDNTAQITSVTVTGSPAKLGEPIVVVLVGEAGGKAEFSISGLISGVTMPEGQAGVYTGRYTAPQGTNVKDALVTARLTDALGNVAERYGSRVTIDAGSRIDSVNVSGSPAKAGGVIGVALFGESGGTARFSIAGVVSNAPMTEAPAGMYTGRYNVVSGVNVTNAVVTVTLTDSVGNIGTDTSQSVTIDTRIPEIASVSVSGSPAKAGDTIRVTLAGEPGASAKFSIAGVEQDIPMTENQPGLYTGAYIVPGGVNVINAALTVTLRDHVGNVNTNANKSVTIDTTIPVINLVSVSGSPARTGDTITVTATGEPGVSARFSIAGVVENVPMTENPPGTYKGIYPAADGINVVNAVLTVTFTDPVGNVNTNAAQSVSIDTQTPVITSVSVSGSPAKAGGTIIITALGDPGMSCKFSIAGVIDSAPMAEDQPGTYRGEFKATAGVNVSGAPVAVKLTDAAGNFGINTSQKVTIDTTVPVISSVSVTGSPAKAGGNVWITAVGEPGVTAQFFIAGIVNNAPMPEAADQPGKYTGAYPVADGVNAADAVVTVILTDGVGNVSVDTSRRVTIDTTIPQIASVNISGDPAKTGGTIAVTAAGEAGGIGQFTIAGVVENVPMTENPPGTYKGIYTVTDDDARVTNAVLTVTLRDVAGNVGSDAGGRVSIRPDWDVNADGIVDAADLTVIGSRFGQTVSERDSADVNRDGRVDLLDLIIVCKNFGLSPAGASPARGTAVVTPDQLAVLRQLYESIDGNDGDLIMVKQLLAELIGLPAIQITRSRLMQNYPNPCNPETWIPYELAEPGSVTIRIYNSTGQLIRTLDLGYRAMGSYSSRNKAAYWDGRNEDGEEVASGLYFYSIHSDDFTQVRKLTVLR